MHKSRPRALAGSPGSVSGHRWWILCRVIDNLGDAGVCWRLARRLAAGHGREVTLFIDRPELIVRLAGGESHPVRVLPWPEDAPAGSVQSGQSGQSGQSEQSEQSGERSQAVRPCRRPPEPVLPDVLVSAFGCEPPAWLRARLAGAPARPLWINLEYLSAEAWIDGCHGLASVKPDGAIEHFLYPGFTAASGGLLREPDALAPLPLPVGTARADALAALCGQRPEPGERVVSLFCYPSPQLAAWLKLLAKGARRVLLLACDASGTDEIRAFAGQAPIAGAAPLRTGCLRIARIPFLPQPGYDRLLQLADLNFVRGEDSWVRAHWARRPFVWQPYRQQDEVHLDKLAAFLSRLRAAFPDALPAERAALAAIETMLRAWSGSGPLAPAWQDFDDSFDTIAGLFARWSETVASLPELSTSLVEWAEGKL